MQLSGIHHLTAISADAPGNVKFYTKLLGLRMVKKTVNQDDVSAYHLFYADGLASPGSDIHRGPVVPGIVEPRLPPDGEHRNDSQQQRETHDATEDRG